MSALSHKLIQSLSSLSLGMGAGELRAGGEGQDIRDTGSLSPSSCGPRIAGFLRLHDLDALREGYSKRFFFMYRGSARSSTGRYSCRNMARTGAEVLITMRAYTLKNMFNSKLIENAIRGVVRS